MRTSILVSLVLAGCKPVVPTAPTADTVRIRIAAINDFHGALYETRVKGLDGDAFGGLPWLVSAVDLLKSEDPELIVLDAGDQFQGSWPVNASQGMGAIRAMELLRLDAAAVGNHEFDYGGTEDGHPLRGAIEAAAARAPYPFLAANITQGDRPWRPEGVSAWTVIERKGKRIGVVGLSTMDTPTTTVPRNVEGLTFEDIVKTVEDLQPELDDANLDATVLVAHLTGQCDPEAYMVPGEPCTPNAEVGRLLTELPAGTFDVMVLGHAHTLLAHRDGDTFLVESRAKGHGIGLVDLVFDPDGLDLDASRVHAPWPIVHPPADPGCEGGDFPTDPILVGGRVLTPNPDALALIADLEAEAGSLCQELTCASRPLTRSRAAEAELGNWMADGLRTAFPDVDIGVQNSGGIRADLPEGPVRREHVQGVMPFDNRAMLLEMTGAQVRTMLQIGTSGAHGILQVSGVTYAADPETMRETDLDGDGETADWERDHLCDDDIRVGGKRLDDTATYRVVTSDFLFEGGDHLGPAFAEAKVLEKGPLLRESLYAYAEATEGCIGDTPLIDPEAPRIRVGACE